MPAIFPASRFRAGIRDEQDLDDAARLLLDDSGQHHRAVRRDRHEQDDGHDERGRLIVGAAPRN